MQIITKSKIKNEIFQSLNTQFWNFVFQLSLCSPEALKGFVILTTKYQSSPYIALKEIHCISLQNTSLRSKLNSTQQINWRTEGANHKLGGSICYCILMIIKNKSMVNWKFTKSHLQSNFYCCRSIVWKIYSRSPACTNSSPVKHQSEIEFNINWATIHWMIKRNANWW